MQSIKLKAWKNIANNKYFIFYQYPYDDKTIKQRMINIIFKVVLSSMGKIGVFH